METRTTKPGAGNKYYIRKASGGYSNGIFGSIGYKEFAEYFNGAITLNEAADRLRQQTRRYAKRQLSWFRRMNGRTVYVDDFTSNDSLCNYVLEQYTRFLKGGDTV